MELIFNLDGIDEAARQFISLTSKNYSVFLFDAKMGAGKTTFIRELCKQYGVISNVSSPTFSIINQYDTKDGGTIYHLDLYRVKDDEEAVRAGVEECLYSGDPCFVEWPFNASSILPEGAALVNIETMRDGSRKLSLRPA